MKQKIYETMKNQFVFPRDQREIKIFKGKKKRSYNISMILLTKSGVDMFRLILENAKVLYK